MRLGWPVALVWLVVVVATAAGVIGVGKAVVLLVIVTVGALLGLRVNGPGPSDGSPRSGGPGGPTSP